MSILRDGPLRSTTIIVVHPDDIHRLSMSLQAVARGLITGRVTVADGMLVRHLAPNGYQPRRGVEIYACGYRHYRSEGRRRLWPEQAEILATRLLERATGEGVQLRMEGGPATHCPSAAPDPRMGRPL